MLIVHLGPKERVGLPRIEASGNLLDLLHDLLTVTRAMHKQVGSADAGAAEAFRQAITATVNDEKFWKAEVSGIGWQSSRKRRSEYVLSKVPGVRGMVGSL